MTGKIILLNGPSSSGKSTIAKELQEILAEPYILFPIDCFLNFYLTSLPKRFFPPPVRKNISFPEGLELRDKEIQWLKLLTGFHNCIVALSNSEINVIVEHVLESSFMVAHCLNTLCGFPVLFVGVQCNLAELRRRETLRNDRKSGMGEAQYHVVHTHTCYHLSVDTSTDTPEICAQKIKAVLIKNEDSLTESFKKLHEKALDSC
ncbi:MAG: chloramphenicol phosphotransferase [Candidatus Heimdallarchaeota archaeon]|nr:chloramphenicol phosphotransferase [Candidatus Heimdallarchaeota archaeon]